jgi:hypothetical protein
VLAAGVFLFEAVQLEFCCVLVGAFGGCLCCRVRRTGLEFIDETHFGESFGVEINGSFESGDIRITHKGTWRFLCMEIGNRSHSELAAWTGCRQRSDVNKNNNVTA